MLKQQKTDGWKETINSTVNSTGCLMSVILLTYNVW